MFPFKKDDPISPSTAGGGKSLMELVTANPGATAIFVVVVIICLAYGWRELKQQLLIRTGKQIPPLTPIVSKYVRYAFTEDVQPAITTPRSLAVRLAWLTGRTQTILTLLAVPVLGVITQKPVPALAPLLLLALPYQRAKQTFTYRDQQIRVMYEVATAEFKYPKGSELTPEAWVIVQEWKDLYFPRATVINFPSGWRSEEARNRERFEDNFNSTVTKEHRWEFDWEPSASRVTVTPTPLLPTMAPYPGVTPRKWHEIPLGMTYGGKEVVLDVAVNPHCLIAGTTGSGKSVLQRSILLHCLSNPTWRVIGLDPKRVELASLRDKSQPNGLKPNVLRVATTLEDMTAALEQAEQEMMRRFDEMESAGKQHVMDLPNPPPALLVMVDETYALLAPEGAKDEEGKERDAMHARCTTLVGSIARLGRAASVHIILATQRPDAKVIPGETRANLDARVACARMDTTPSLMVLDSDKATGLPRIKGRSMIRFSGDYIEFQSYFCDGDRFDQVIAEGRAAYASAGTQPTAAPVAAPVGEAGGKKAKLPWAKKKAVAPAAIPGLTAGSLFGATPGNTQQAPARQPAGPSPRRVTASGGSGGGGGLFGPTAPPRPATVPASAGSSGLFGSGDGAPATVPAQGGLFDDDPPWDD